MTYKLQPSTMIEIRAGLQSIKKTWSVIAWEHIGSKSPDLKTVSEEIESNGVAGWNGFTLTHEDYNANTEEMHPYRVEINILNDRTKERRTFAMIANATCVDNAISIAKCCAGMTCEERPVGSSTQRVD